MRRWRYSAMVLALCAAAPPAADAYQLRYSRTGAIIHWERTHFPIHYYIDSNPAMPQEAVAAVIRAFQSWENVGPSRLSFVYRGLRKNPAVANDGKNCVIWVENGWRHGEHTISHATTWYSLEDGSIVDCDIEINGRDYDWSADSEGGSLDIQNVMTHEVGHLLGFDDVFSSLDETMFGFILTGETAKRSLSVEDIAGSCFLYPLAATFETMEAALIDSEKQSLSTYLPPRDTPGSANIILISSCDVARDSTPGDVASVSYDAESGFSFRVYGLPGPDAEEKEIATLVDDDWAVASGDNARAMAVMDADGDGFKDEIAILKDYSDGESFVEVYKLSGPGESPALLCSVSLGADDPTTHMAGAGAGEVYVVKKAGGKGYALSLHGLDVSGAALPRTGEYGELPVGLDEEILSVFPLEQDAGPETALGVLVVDGKGRARIDFIEPTTDGGVASSLTVQLPGASPVLATSVDSNGDGLLNEIVLITE